MTIAAFLSASEEVSRAASRCDSADTARLFWILEARGSRITWAASAAIDSDVTLVFLAPAGLADAYFGPADFFATIDLL